MDMKQSLLLLKLMVIMYSCTVDGQSANLSNYGSEFFVGFLRHPPGTDELNLQLHILTQRSSPVQFNIQSLTGSYNHTGLTSVGSMQAVSIPVEFHTSLNTYDYRHNGLRITTLETEAVSVIAYSWRSGDYAAYYAWPCHQQPTTEYIYHAVSLLSTAQTSLGEDSVSEFLLVGCQNNTNITITPSQDIKLPEDPQVQGSLDVLVVKGTSRSFILHQSQTLLIAEMGVDLSGSKIASDKPVTVLSGHEIAQVPLGAADGDPVVTQLAPTISWGKQFLVPTDEKTSGRLLKMTASDSGTVVDMQCGTSTCISVSLPSAGSVREVNLNSSDYCGAVSNKPVQLAMFGRSSSENGGVGDPYLISIPPVEQYSGTVQVSTGSATGVLDITNTIIMPANGFFDESILLDNLQFTLQPWKEIFLPNSTLAGYGSTALHGSSYQTFSHPSKHGTLFVSVYGQPPGISAGFGYSAGAMQYPVATTSILPEITLTFTEYTVDEGMGQVKVTLERTRNYVGEVTVQLDTSPHPVDTAVAGDDYEEISSLITFQAEQVTKEVIIAITDDQYAEPVEHFTLRIEAVEGGVVFPIAEAVVHINDDDSLRVQITKGDLSLENKEISVSTDVTNGILQYDQEVAIELTIDVLGVTTLPPVSLLFNQHTHGFITRVTLLEVEIGQSSVLRATVKQVETKVALELGDSILITPTVTAPSDGSTTMPSPTASATACSQPEITDCTLLVYVATALLVVIFVFELLAALICCWVCYQRGRKRGAEQTTLLNKKSQVKSRPLPDLPMDYTMNPTYNLQQEHSSPSGMQDQLIPEDDEDDEEMMMDNPGYNRHQSMASLDGTEQLDLTTPQQQSMASQEPSEGYSYMLEERQFLQGFDHQDSRVEISDTLPLIAAEYEVARKPGMDEDTSEANEVQEKMVTGGKLQAAKNSQDGQTLSAKLVYQNVGSRQKQAQDGTNYQNIGHRKNHSRESTGNQTVPTHQKLSQQGYENTGSHRKASAGGTRNGNSESAGKIWQEHADYQNTGPSQQQLRVETGYQNTGPNSSQSEDDQKGPSWSRAERRDKMWVSQQVQQWNAGRGEHTQRWPLSTGTIKSDERSITGHHATYDLLTYQLESSDDQESASSTGDDVDVI